MLDRLPALMCVLEDIADKSRGSPSGDRSVEAQGQLAQIDLHFIGLLAIFQLLGDNKLLSDVLDTAQKCNISIERVKKSQRKTSSRLEGSVVTSTVGERRSDPDDKDEIYESNLDDLRHKLHQAKRILERKRKG
ncbi:hypothetical protein N1851_033797 [Merluccius polli]|uniref:Uncharacterized protein n=1 Tax=Merluccius polli TaxID=89951 RepID=A0AA47M0P3_MERPO|nr:hypothetical protein N1851_033797 [Merluccius polli]